MTSDISNDPTAVNEIVGRDAVDPDGDKIGNIVDVYVDNDTGEPEWLAFSTGLFGTKVSFAPLAEASLSGDVVALPYTKDQVKDATRVDADGQLSPQEEDELYAHYGRSFGGTERGDGTARQTDDAMTRSEREYGTTSQTDDAMTRSEEEVDISKTTRQAGTARIRKWVETEDVQMTVPIRREKAKLVTEPITDTNVDEALSGEDITEGEHEVVLSEEIVDVDKRVVPKERVRLETDVDTDEVVVDEAVRKERIEFDNETDR